MPKDTGSVTNNTIVLDAHRAARAVEEPTTVGAQLRAAREAQGQTLQQVAEQTRVRRAYLAAIEDMRADLLPSRPFAVGYAKAYAKALGLDGESIAERFRDELHDPDAHALRAPVGVAHEKGGVRYPLLAAAGAVLAAVVLLWNVAQRAVNFEETAPSAIPEAPEAWLQAAAPSAPVPLGVPTPAPAEQTTPQPYQTPGLDVFAAQRAAIKAGQAPPPSPAPMIVGAPTGPRATLPPAPPPSAAQGVKPKTYGAGVPAQSVVLVARTGAALVVRDAAGRVVFGRQLQHGDSWRGAPAAGLFVDTLEPEAFDVYAYGQFKGQLAGPVVALPQLAR